MGLGLSPNRTGLSGQFLSNNSKTVSGTTETTLIPSGIGQNMIPAGWFQPGFNARMVIRGTVSTPLVAGSGTIRVKVGNVTLASASIGSLLSSLSLMPFSVICNIQCYTNGTTGTFGVAGEVRYPTGLAGVQVGSTVINSTSTVLDTTIDQGIDITAQWALSGHSVSTTIYTLELLGMS